MALALELQQNALYIYLRRETQRAIFMVISFAYQGFPDNLIKSALHTVYPDWHFPFKIE
jgi:hypothetical protein